MTFEEHLKKYLPKDEINKLMDSFSESEKKAIYLNTTKMSEETLFKLFPNLTKHPVVKNGYLFDHNEYKFGKKVYHEQGAYYIQEPSAMIVASLLDAKPDDVVLDLCGAPGGKTVQTSLKMKGEGLIIANDLSKNRANILLSNVERMGLGNVVVTSLDFNKQKDKFSNYFDKIILDAPCSGSGMFRKSQEMKADWTYEKVIKNAAIQKDLILMCYQMLKEGGTMIYSTCSYSFEEDEEVVKYLLEKTDAKLVNIPKIAGEFRSNELYAAIHLFPSHFDGEGHFICLISKPGNKTTKKLLKNTINRTYSTKGGEKENQFFVLNTELPRNFTDLCLRPGLFKESKLNNGKIIPSHHYSHFANSDKSISLNKEETIKYLKGESLNKKHPDGYFIVSYNNVNLGMVHSVNGTLKNLYPKGLRFNASITESF